MTGNQPNWPKEVIQIQIQYLLDTAIYEISNSSDIGSLDTTRVKYLGRKGLVAEKMNLIRNCSIENRPSIGSAINKVKKIISIQIEEKKVDLEQRTLDERVRSEMLDVSLPGRNVKIGSLHPVTLTVRCIEDFFNKLGFESKSGPEIEDAYHNFDALNIPIHHPARSSNDTFWLDSNRLLRTQTSSVQIRTMKNSEIPIRVIAPGRVYRNDNDSTHTPMFHQIEGLAVDKGTNFSHLKALLVDFLDYFFDKDVQTRFRSSYFPFTEPSAEVDILGKNGIWLEVLGCGMVHPNVLQHAGIDSELYTGFAFGLGVERLAMLRYGFEDIRKLFENDLRFLSQFR
jgi:phenylalanyl-tRNA synthetase alpha chain